MRLGLLALLVCPSFAATLPTPESHFGHRMGADRKLLDWDKIVSYFQALEKSSDRIQVRELGKTPGGRPLIAHGTGAREPVVLNETTWLEIRKRIEEVA